MYRREAKTRNNRRNNFWRKLMKKHPLTFQNGNVRKIRKKKPYFTIRFLVLGKNLVLCMEKLLEFLNKESYLDFKKGSHERNYFENENLHFPKIFSNDFLACFLKIIYTRMDYEYRWGNCTQSDSMYLLWPFNYCWVSTVCLWNLAFITRWRTMAILTRMIGMLGNKKEIFIFTQENYNMDLLGH